MPRKPVVDREEVLRMLQEGRSTQVVAEHYGVTRQAIDLHRKDFIRQGLLSSERAARRPRTAPAPVGTPPAPPPQAPAKHPQEALPAHPITASLDDLIELVIRAVSALRRLPELEAELETSRREHHRAIEELERLRAEAQKRHDQELRWRLLQNGQHPSTPPHL